MSTNFRDLLADLLKMAEESDDYFLKCPDVVALADRARAALSQPEGEGPTDEDLCNLADALNACGDPVPAMRRALELWGRPAPQPIPITERLPGEGDCALWPDEPDVDPWCWAAKDVDGSWEWTQLGVSHFSSSLGKVIQGQGYTHWLPHWALPLPKGGADA